MKMSEKEMEMELDYLYQDLDDLDEDTQMEEIENALKEIHRIEDAMDRGIEIDEECSIESIESEEE